MVGATILSPPVPLSRLPPRLGAAMRVGPHLTARVLMGTHVPGQREETEADDTASIRRGPPPRDREARVKTVTSLVMPTAGLGMNRVPPATSVGGVVWRGESITRVATTLPKDHAAAIRAGEAFNIGRVPTPRMDV